MEKQVEFNIIISRDKTAPFKIVINNSVDQMKAIFFSGEPDQDASHLVEMFTQYLIDYYPILINYLNE